MSDSPPRPSVADVNAATDAVRVFNRPWAERTARAALSAAYSAPEGTVMKLLRDRNRLTNERNTLLERRQEAQNQIMELREQLHQLALDP